MAMADGTFNARYFCKRRRCVAKERRTKLLNSVHNFLSLYFIVILFCPVSLFVVNIPSSGRNHSTVNAKFLEAKYYLNLYSKFVGI